ncbi:hypothetical protein NDU88_008904, partial [Pleurodeles waltl]
AGEKGPFQVEGGNTTFFPDFTLAFQTQRATFLEVKRSLREEGLRYSLLFPSKLKVILDGTTHFFQEPDEVWAWVGAYRRGPTDIKQVEHRQPHRRGKRQHAKDSQKDRKVTKPTSKEACQGKRAALQAVASLTEARSSEDGRRSKPESLNGEDSTDIESMTSMTEGLPQATPLTSVDII